MFVRAVVQCHPMRFLVALIFGAVILSAQQPAGKAPPMPKNLKVLAADTDIRFVMQGFAQALGVQCTYCHVQGDFASDDKPQKETARKMIAMVRQIDLTFPSSAGVFPAGYHEVDCSTCHRGSAKPETKASREFFNRNESQGAPPPRVTPGVNLKVVPTDTRVHGDGSIMHDFRDALNVDCGFCHGGGVGFEKDLNPRKDIARKMIQMVRQINANFPGTGVYPLGDQKVTCYTCHRGDPHPATVSNFSYPPPAAEKK